MDAPLPFVLSGATEAELSMQARALGDHLAAHPDLSLADVAYSLATVPTHLAHRAVVVASAASLRDELDALAAGDATALTIVNQVTPAGKLALLFAGHGSQRADMGREL